jgi:hypothetical protein
VMDAGEKITRLPPATLPATCPSMCHTLARGYIVNRS